MERHAARPFLAGNQRLRLWPDRNRRSDTLRATTSGQKRFGVG